jgi:5'(3')-deoxyribonucleotidase
MNIYVDMDEVVADFKGYAEEFFQRKLNFKKRLPPEEWSRLADNPRLYRDLKVRDGGHSLINWLSVYCYENNVGLFFLTAIPAKNDVPYAIMDKVEWCQKYFPGIPVFFGPRSYEKAARCTPGDILIDDRLSNVNEWREAGGVAFQYRNWPECKEWLEETLNINI